MKIIITIAVIVLAAAAVLYFSPAFTPSPTFESVIFESGDYAKAVESIAASINALPPTPPTEQTWTVRDVEFVKNEPYAYVVYHDTHNIFRILLETGNNQTFRTVAAFEAGGAAWRLTGGEDLAAGRETVKISSN